MSLVTPAISRPARWPGLLHRACTVLASGLLALAATATAAPVTNTASATFTRGGLPVVLNSNTSVIHPVPAPSPGVVTFYALSPAVPGSLALPFDGSEYDDGGGFRALPAPIRTNGMPVSLAAPVTVRETRIYHTGEPVFITLADANRNIDASIREYVEVVLTSDTGDREVLRLQETGPDTGVFVGVIQSSNGHPAMALNNGYISLATNTKLTVNYQDPFYLTDISASAALVDPFGFVFDSTTGQPVDGATVTLRTAGGALATVFGDDGVSAFPATVVTGSTVTDAGGTAYNLPAGGFRFPFIAPGDYYFEIAPPAGYGVPSSVATGSLPANPATGNPYAVVNGSRGEIFTVLPGPALNIDVPADPATGGMFLQKLVSRTEASAGDFLQYRLVLKNTSAVPAAVVNVVDTLPAGLRYEANSLTVDGVRLANPAVSSDGRTLTFAAGALAAGASLEIRYVAKVGPGTAVGNAVNSARASANAGVLTSNTAQVAVRIREPLMSGQATLIGRVLEGDCGTPWKELKGVANARVLLEDGSYVVTDKDGQYHFNGVRPGTHVVQLDVASLPDGLEPVSCLENTRFAGRNFSQFVDVKGGALWRADFHTRARRGSVGLRLQSSLLTRETVQEAAQVKEVGDAPRNVRNFTLRAQFDSCSAALQPEGEASVQKLIDDLNGADIRRIELVGNTDDQRMSARCRQVFADNYALSQARARTVGDLLATGLFLRPDQVGATGVGPDNPVASNKTPAGMALNRRTEVKVYLNDTDAEPVPAPAAATTGPVVKRTEVVGARHRIEVDGDAAASGTKVSVAIPEGTVYRPGSARLDGQAMAEPQLAEGTVVLALPDAPAGSWQRVLEFETQPLHPLLAPAQAVTRRFTLRARFENCSAALHSSGREAINRLLADINLQGRVEAVELVGHTDNEPLSDICRQRYADATALTQARAQAVGSVLGGALGLPVEAVSASGRGDAEPVAANDTPANRARNRRIEVAVRFAADPGATVHAGAAAATMACTDTPLTVKASAGFRGSNGKRVQTPVALNQLACATGEGSTEPRQATSERQGVEVREFARMRELPPELKAHLKARESIPDDVSAGGGNNDWLADPRPAPAWLFPGERYNPRAPAARIVIKHLPGQAVVLRTAAGEPVNSLNFEGVKTSGDRRSAVSLWRGVPLQPGRNGFVAEVRNADGSVAATLQQDIHYAGVPVRAELVPEQSLLVADGIHRPVLAVRLLDRDGRPVRAGITGPVRLAAPYRTWEEVRREQERQLAGMDRYEPQYKVEGDDGIAYIELAPTTESGNALLEFNFQPDADSLRHQEVRAWLAPQARDWVVVGFAEGTVGYNTLSGNMQPLAGTEEGGYADGQVSLYAKGRVLGQWLLTMAYDSDKSRERQSLLGVIDPQQFYTLYGDGTEQRYDAASQGKLYLKLERGQFYALFGDYDTGLNANQLSRYNRTLNGLKVEDAGGPLVFTAFAAETTQNFARDEIQGNGTSGLYRLSQRNIVLNSEKIVIETRDRLQSQQRVESRFLTRHLDYDIDYANGTIFFRQPIPSRDTNFNPTFIVAEYETMGVADTTLNAGGRIGLNLRDGKLQAGLTAVRDEDNLGQSDLAGADLKLRVGADSELRMEVAQTRGQVATLSPEGMAWLAELEHHSGRYDALVYARRQEAGFGLGQQSGFESGTQKLGADGQVRLGRNWSVLGQVYQQQSDVSDVTRDAAQAKVQYKTQKGGFSLGLQGVNDSAGSGALAGQDFRSEQASASANRFFFNQKLELTAQAESAIGGNRESLDFPNRYLLGANYAISDKVRLLAGQELTDGAAFDTSTTRVGFQATPWKGARLDSTLNQQDMGEYGPRTFGLFGLTQGFVVNARWGVDLSVDSSQTLKAATRAVPVVNPGYPVAPGGSLTGPGLTEDFVAVSTGATYRSELWSWNGRLEDRNGEQEDRYGLTSNFLRNAQAGVAFSTSSQIFRTEQDRGGDGWLGSLDLAWAWRPLGQQWSILDRLEFRYEALEGGSGIAGSGLFGNNSLVGSSASTRRVINNFALNRVSREWTGKDRTGNLFRRYERNQLSFYYGAKYVQDSIDGAEYDGFIDLVGLEVRHDLREWLDIGLQASSLNDWEEGAHAYSFGPQVGASPVTNGWITLGWNIKGFTDRDFDAARYTAQGPYLQLRFKFDQNTRLRRDRKGADPTVTSEQVQP